MESIESILQSVQELYQRRTKLLAAECHPLLSKLKIKLAQLQSTSEGETIENLQLAREGYELAVLLSVKLRDEVAFEKYTSLLRPYYFDYGLAESERQNLILGLHLLFLLTKARIGDFHIALELLPPLNNSLFIKFPLDLERDMTEGCINKIWQARESVPDESYIFFVEMLVDAAREDIAKCMESSYDGIDIQGAMSQLHFTDQTEFQKFVEDEKRGWVIQDSRIEFHPLVDHSVVNLDAHQLIQQSLAYTHEIERII